MNNAITELTVVGAPDHGPVAAPVADTGQEYSITIRNNSSITGDFMIYQPDVSFSPEVRPLAWLAHRAFPGVSLMFQWRLRYSFVWGHTGLLKPGVLFTAAEKVPANLTTLNQITFGYDKAAGIYKFTDQQGGPVSDLLFIKESDDIPVDSAASVGIGLGDAPTHVLQARPNFGVRLAPPARYFVALDNYQQGEVVDTRSVMNQAPVVFPPDVYAMIATWTANGTWIIEPVHAASNGRAEAQASPGRKAG